MTGGRLDFLPSHVRKADGGFGAGPFSTTSTRTPPSSETAARNPPLERNLARPTKASDVVVSMKSYTDADLEITGRARETWTACSAISIRAGCSTTSSPPRSPKAKVQGAADVRMNFHLPFPATSSETCARQYGHRNATFFSASTCDGLRASMRTLCTSRKRACHARAPSKQVRRRARQGHRRNEGRRHDARHRCPSRRQPNSSTSSALMSPSSFLQKLTGTSPVHVDAEIRAHEGPLRRHRQDGPSTASRVRCPRAL